MYRPWFPLLVTGAVATALLTGCTEENTDPEPENTAPVISLYAPNDGSTVPHGDVATFTGRVDDAEDGPGALSVTWGSSVDGEQGSVSLGENGDFSFEAAGLSAGTQRVTLTATDGDGATTSRSVNLSLQANSPPTIAIESPSGGDIFLSDEIVELDARVSDDIDASSSLSVTIETSLGGGTILAEGLTAESSGTLTVPLDLDPGAQDLRVTATDSEGLVGQSTVSVYISSNHSEPQCSITSPTDSVVEVGTSLLFEGMVEDPDVPSNELEVEWASSLDGVFATASADSDGVVSSFYDGLSEGDHTIVMRVYADEDGTCESSLTLRVYPVHDAPDVEITAPLEGDDGAVGEPVLFTASIGDDIDDPEDLWVSWSSDIDGEFDTSPSDAAGNLSFQYDKLSYGTHLISLTVTDSGGKAHEAVVVLDLYWDEDGDGYYAEPDGLDCDDSSSLIRPGGVEVLYDGVDQDCSGEDAADQDGDGSSGGPEGDDCDDLSGSVHPDAPEVPYDGIDQDCSGADLLDVDGDGFAGMGTDCNDFDPLVYPGASEIAYNSVDENCNGFDLLDVDGDGFAGPSGTGDDCDDEDDEAFPGGIDLPYDGIDQDCSGLDLTDIDLDGYDAVEAGGNDCDDTRSATHPGSLEVAYNGEDDDCEDGDMVDIDGDTWASVLAGGTDCEDDDPTIYPSRPEIAYDGIDNDCASGDLDDVDGDGHVWEGIGGNDCNDDNSLIFTGATESPYNGVDEDCSGADLVDVDGDGYMAEEAGGDDCDDYLPYIHPGATEIPANPYDENCDGVY